MDLGCYCVNTARYIFESEPTKVYASSLYHLDHDAEAQLQGILEFPDNRTVVLDCSFLLPWQSEYEVVGENGRIRALDTYNPGRGKEVKIEITKGEDVEVETIQATDEYRLEVDHFTKMVSEGSSPAISKEDSLGNIRTLEALYKSAEAGKPVFVNTG